MLLVYMPYSSPRMSLGGWWGTKSLLGKSHSCQGTSPTFSLLNHLVAVSSFLVCVSGMCIWTHASWNLAFEIPRTWFLYLKPFCLTLPGLLCPVLLPMALRISLHCWPTPPLSISASNQGEVYTVILQRKKLKWCKCTCGIYTQRCRFSAASALKPAEHLMHSAFSFVSRKQNKQQYNSDDGNSVMFTFI